MQKIPSVLEEAQELVNGERQNDYGDPVEFFRQWAAMHSYLSGTTVSAQNLCLAMIEMKLLRYKNSRCRHRDSLVDAAGYIAIMERLGCV